MELSQKVELLIYQWLCVPPLTCGHELWAVTERMRARMRAVKGEEAEEEVWLLRPGSCPPTLDKQLDGWMDLGGVFQLWGAKPMRGCLSDCVCGCLSPLNVSDWLDIHLFSFLSLHLQSPRLSLLGSFPLISYHISFHYSTGESCWGTKSLFLFWKLACFCHQKVKLFLPAVGL